MTKVVDIRTARDPRDVIHLAVEHLVQGDLVVLPTESYYTITAFGLHEAAIQKLAAISSRRDPESQRGGEAKTGIANAFGHVLALKSPSEIYDFIPEISRLGTKIARCFWPGAVVLGFDPPKNETVFRSLPQQTRNIVQQNQAIWFRISANHSMMSALQLLPGPVVQVCWENGAAPCSAEAVASQFSEHVSLIVDEGPVQKPQSETILRVENNSLKNLQAGLIAEDQLVEMSRINYLFVCTGNTCRSPMAEGLLRMKMAEQLNCKEEQLAEHGFSVISAGISAMYGSPASPESVEIVATRGGQLQEHASQQVTEHLLNEADYIFAMTRGHRDAILTAFPDVVDRLHLLSVDGKDISDPYGGDMSAYLQCEAEILKGIEQILGEIQKTD